MDARASGLNIMQSMLCCEGAGSQRWLPRPLLNRNYRKIILCMHGRWAWAYGKDKNFDTRARG